ncbi:conserved hypothetical protein [Sclerotinia sclerotiorum 1980 UF-70]|uniref:Derlin n=1 Tax=Sclerotinia sclerotiorum (strain ATCC 18683 / 1980 / Ss-1) TaxID=665079 RepID=A7E4T1_SCLS1|nr:conserved hypothetical protein [Sclerotinia sclerotiorum 1980 UF-70]EDN90903.1 conserved hypothetical protein [Sclerotinia sclerotiorum 1980 UF-70]
MSHPYKSFSLNAIPWTPLILDSFFTAPYLPWVLMGFSLVLHGTVPKDEMMGVVIGHIWYFFNDVYPPLHNGHRPFDPPMFWRRLFERRPREETANAINNDIAMAAAPAPEVR